MKGVEVNGGDGCVAPVVETAQDGTYKPLSRPLFIYVSDAALKKPQVVAFIDFYLNNSQKIVEAAKFIPLTEEQLKTAKDELAALHSKVS